jgi:hypothetical protein
MIAELPRQKRRVLPIDPNKQTARGCGYDYTGVTHRYRCTDGENAGQNSEYSRFHLILP